MAVDYTVTYDPGATDANTFLVAQVRMDIQDVDLTTPPSSILPRAQWSVLFTDQEILMVAVKYAAMVNQEDMAAAHLLDDIASNAALLAKHITLGDYSSDTRSAAAGLRAQADSLRGRYARSQAAGSEEPAESITDEVWDDFSARRRLWGSVFG